MENWVKIMQACPRQSRAGVRFHDSGRLQTDTATRSDYAKLLHKEVHYLSKNIRIQLMVLKSNVSALRLYKNLGYKRDIENETDKLLSLFKINASQNFSQSDSRGGDE